MQRKNQKQKKEKEKRNTRGTTQTNTDKNKRRMLAPGKESKPCVAILRFSRWRQLSVHSFWLWAVSRWPGRSRCWLRGRCWLTADIRPDVAIIMTPAASRSLSNKPADTPSITCHRVYMAMVGVGCGTGARGMAQKQKSKMKYIKKEN